jgi:hypothetical protein
MSVLVGSKDTKNGPESVTKLGQKGLHFPERNEESKVKKKRAVATAEL